MEKEKENRQEGSANRSLRERQPTEKGKQMQDIMAKKQLKAFLKKFCRAADLEEINKQIQSQYDHVNQNYEPLQRNSINTEDIVQKMDTCSILTTEICDLLSDWK